MNRLMGYAPNGRAYAKVIELPDGITIDVTAIRFTDDPAAPSAVTEAYYRIADREGRQARAVAIDGRLYLVEEPLPGSWGDGIRAALRRSWL